MPYDAGYRRRADIRICELRMFPNLRTTCRYRYATVAWHSSCKTMISHYVRSCDLCTHCFRIRFFLAKIQPWLQLVPLRRRVIAQPARVAISARFQRLGPRPPGSEPCTYLAVQRVWLAWSKVERRAAARCLGCVSSDAICSASSSMPRRAAAMATSRKVISRHGSAICSARTRAWITSPVLAWNTACNDLTCVACSGVRPRCRPADRLSLEAFRRSPARADASANLIRIRARCRPRMVAEQRNLGRPAGLHADYLLWTGT
jgi:hypothetical protein